VHVIAPGVVAVIELRVASIVPLFFIVRGYTHLSPGFDNVASLILTVVLVSEALGQESPVLLVPVWVGVALVPSKPISQVSLFWVTSEKEIFKVVDKVA